MDGTFDQPSSRRLIGLHPDLVEVALLSRSRIAFRITDGLRTIEQQREYVRNGASKTMRSRHLTGHAFDFVAFTGDGHVTWDKRLMAEVARIIREAAHELGIPVEWGGDWKGSWDSPHIQLPWQQYPA